MTKPSTYLIFLILLLTIKLTSQSDITTRYDFKFDKNNILTGIRIWFIVPINKDTTFEIQPTNKLTRKEIELIKKNKTIPEWYYKKLNLRTVIVLNRDTTYQTPYPCSSFGYVHKPLKIKIGTKDSLKLYKDIDNFEEIIKPYLHSASYIDNIHLTKIELTYEYPWAFNWTTRNLTIKLPRQNKLNPK